MIKNKNFLKENYFEVSKKKIKLDNNNEAEFRGVGTYKIKQKFASGEKREIFLNTFDIEKLHKDSEDRKRISKLR